MSDTYRFNGPGCHVNPETAREIEARKRCTRRRACKHRKRRTIAVLPPAVKTAFLYLHRT